MSQPHMAYKEHYKYYRVNTNFKPPIMEGSFDKFNWVLVSVLITDNEYTNVFKTRAGDYVCRLCGDCIPSEPELHEGRCKG